MNFPYVTLSRASGRILGGGFGDHDSLAALAAISADYCFILRSRIDSDRFYVEGGPFDGLIVDNPKIAERPSLSVANISIPVGGSHVVASALPAGTEVYKDGLYSGKVDDGALELESSIAGRIIVNLRPPFPYQWATFAVTIE